MSQGADFMESAFEGRSFELVEVLLSRGKDEDVIHGVF